MSYMNMEQFIEWMKELKTPQTFTDDLKQDILDNLDDVIVNSILNQNKEV